MRTVRLFLDAPLCVASEVELPDPARRHAAQVLRLKPGDAVVLFNGDGSEYHGRLLGEGARARSVRIEHAAPTARESPLAVTLVQALARGEKMDWIVQKATELGVARIVPVTTERSEVKLDAARGARRHAHWRAIAIAACEQCGRNRLPEVAAPTALPAYLEAAGAAEPGARWMLHPGDGTRIRDLGGPPARLDLAIGPEGGFGAQDLESLRRGGYHELALGPRVLRTETAGIAALAALQAWYGDA